MSLEHEDAAATMTSQTARKLLERASPRGVRLLQLFARQQLLRFDDLLEEFGTSQNGLNALLGHLTLEFQKIQGDRGFHIHLRGLRGWAIGDASGRNLRRALRERDAERQGRLRFPG